MPGGKIIEDVDPETGQKSHEGIGATVGVDVSEQSDFTSASQVATTGSYGGTSGTVASGGRTGAGSRSTPGGGAQGAVQAGRGRLRIVDPFLQANIPIYNEALKRHNIEVEKVLDPLRKQQQVVVGLLNKFQSQTGWWAGIDNFLTDPMALIGLAGVVASGGASAGLAAREALSSWKSEQGAEEAVKKLDAKNKQLLITIQRRSHALGAYKAFTADELDTELASGLVPKGTVYWPTGADKGIVGTANWPKDFMGWLKHSHKLLGKQGLWFRRKLP